jgi:hypothetical protein
MKILMVVLALILIFSLAAGILLIRFDVNQFQPSIRQELENITGNPVTIGKLSLAWHSGLTLEIKGLKIHARGASSEQPAISLETASMVLRLLPLLQGRIQASAIVLKKPHFEIHRDSKGMIRVYGINLQGGKAGSKKASAGLPAVTLPISLYVHRLEIEGGELVFRDEFGPAVTLVPLNQLDAVIKDFSFQRMTDLALSFKAGLAILSPEKNLQVEGKLFWSVRDSILIFEHCQGQLNFDQVDLKELEEKIPVAKSIGLQEAISGQLSLGAEKFKMDRRGFTELTGTAELAGGWLRLSQLATPVEEMNAKLSFKQDVLSLDHFSAKIAGGTFNLSGTLKDIFRKPRTDFKTELENIALENFLPALAANEPQLHGRTTLLFSGKAEGSQWPGWIKTVTGEGRFALKDGVLVNLSLLKDVLVKLPMFPNMVVLVDKQIPDSARFQWDRPDTVFEPFERTFTVKDGVAAMEDVHLLTDILELSGRFQLDLPSHFSGKADCLIGEVLSQTLVQEFPKLQFLGNAKGNVILPVTAEGDLPKVVLQPDLKKVAAKLASASATPVQGLSANKPDVSAKKDGTVSDLSLFGDLVDSATKTVKREEKAVSVG